MITALCYHWNVVKLSWYHFVKFIVLKYLTVIRFSFFCVNLILQYNFLFCFLTFHLIVVNYFKDSDRVSSQKFTVKFLVFLAVF
jgi:hypothetical protein